MPRWITVRKPFDFTWPSRAITAFGDAHLGEHLVKDELADFAVEKGYATEGKVDGSARSRKGGKKRVRSRKGAAAAANPRPVARVGDAGAAAPDRAADRAAVDPDAG